MEFILAIILIILIIILFNKVSGLKKQMDYQDLKIKHLQEQVDKQEKSAPISVVPKINDPEVQKEIIPEKIAEQAKPQPVLFTEEKKREEISTPTYEYTETAIEQATNKTTAFIKDNFLTIIGIVTLVLGIGYFVKYAIDQDWINETSRVIIGLIVGLGIIGIAHKIRQNFEIFSSILIGGGISVLYFTLTIAFREYHIFSQNITFGLLTIVTIFSIILAMLYNRQVLAIFSIIGGFCAPLMISTGESNYVFLFSYLVLLNLSMLYMAWRKNWQIISSVAFIFTSIYSISWLIEDKNTTQILFFGVLYFIFSTTSLFNYFTRKEFTVWNCLLFIANTIISTILISTSKETHPSIIVAIFGLANGIFAWYIYTTSRHVLLKNTLIGLSISLITTAIALEFDSNVVAICFAVESTLLLFLWKKSGENIFKIFFIVMFPFLLIALSINWFTYIDTEIHLPIIFNKIFISSIIVIICSIFNIYLMKDFETEEQFLGFKISHSKFIFVSTSILLMYVGILFELIYQIEPYFSQTLVVSYVFIYTLFFIACILWVREKLNLSKPIIIVLQTVAALCFLLLPITSDIPNESYSNTFRLRNYFIYLIYLVPTIYILYLMLKDIEYKTSTALQSFSAIFIVYIISFELYNLFMLATLNPLQENFSHQQDIFTMILLPIIWAILGFTLIYYGVKKQIKTFPIIGIALFGLIILKLYLMDVWMMSNVFRIISFIVLGVLILSTSFMYKKLKNMMTNLLDKPNENKETES